MNNFKKLVQKIQRRIFAPPTNIEKALLNLLFSIFSKVKLKNNGLNLKENLLIWDIRNNSITFDLLHLLFETSIRFCLKKEEKFDVLYIFSKRFHTRITFNKRI